MQYDRLRSAKSRLNSYRGLASEAYISLSSKDPILTAFQLSDEIQELLDSQKFFRVSNFNIFYFFVQWYLPTPPLGQDMTPGQFVSGV